MSEVSRSGRGGAGSGGSSGQSAHHASLSLLSPAMREVISESWAGREEAAGRPEPSLADLRTTFDAFGDRLPLPEDVAMQDADAAGVPACWLEAPGVDSGRVLLYLHGGGYRLGSLHSHAPLAARLGRASGMRVLLVDYRLAPEHPFPAALEDASAAWRWLRGAEALPACSLALAGDSAGGGLVLALLVALRDAGEELPAAAAVMSPWTDLSLSGASMTERAPYDPVIAPGQLRQMASEYLLDADPHTPLASPLFASLEGLPPLLVQVGADEVLLSDAERLAQAAADAGVEVALEVGAGLPHVYQMFLATPEATEATARIGDFLRRRVR